LWCLSHFATVRGGAGAILEVAPLAELEALFYRKPIQVHVIQVLFAMVSAGVPATLFEEMTQVFLRICDSCAEANLPLTVLGLAMLSDDQQFPGICARTPFQPLVSKLLMSSGPHVLKPVLHILRNVVLALDFDNFPDLARLVALLAEPGTPSQIVDSVSCVLGILARRTPAAIASAVPGIIDVLCNRLEGDSLSSKGACLSALVRIVQSFPAQWPGIVSAEFVELLCHFLEAEDTELAFYTLAMLTVILESDPGRADIFASANGWESITELAESGPPELARRAEIFRRHFAESHQMPTALGNALIKSDRSTHSHF
jgi:hypothetical protein